MCRATVCSLYTGQCAAPRPSPQLSCGTWQTNSIFVLFFPAGLPDRRWCGVVVPAPAAASLTGASVSALAGNPLLSFCRFSGGTQRQDRAAWRAGASLARDFIRWRAVPATVSSTF